MSSAQQSHLERAEEEARNAAEELTANRVERERQHPVEDEAVEHQRGGILGSIKEGSKSIFQALAGKVDDAAGENKDSAVDRAAGEEAKKNERVIKDTTATDSTPQTKSESRKDIDYKEPLAARGHHVIDYLTGIKEGTRQWIAEAGERTPANFGQTTESARRQVEEVDQRAAEKTVEDRQKVEEEQRRAEAGYNVNAEKGMAAKGTIYDATSDVMDAMKEKMVMPTDVVRHKRREAEKKTSSRGD